MTETALANDLPTRPWTVEGFRMFWANPKNPQLAASVVWPDIRGLWPRAKGPLIGREAYIRGIENLLAAIPDFRAEPTDYAFNGDVAFVRWEATGKLPVGPDIMTGVDRIILKDGFIRENQIHSDHTVFEYLAETAALG